MAGPAISAFWASWGEPGMGQVIRTLSIGWPALFLAVPLYYGLMFLAGRKCPIFSPIMNQIIGIVILVGGYGIAILLLFHVFQPSSLDQNLGLRTQSDQMQHTDFAVTEESIRS